MLAVNREGYTLRFANEECGGTYPSTYVLDRDILRHCDGASVWHDDSHGIIPDLRDPATVGCLLALVREAFADPPPGPVPVTVAERNRPATDPLIWFVVWSHGPAGDPFTRPHPTEAEALVAALEASQ